MGKKAVYIIYLKINGFFDVDNYPGIDQNFIDYEHVTKYYIYAWTKKKEVLEDFLSQRDRSLFYYKKEVVPQSLLLSDLKDCKLAYRVYYTKQECNDVYKSVPVKILSTVNEKRAVKEEYSDTTMEDVSDDIFGFIMDRFKGSCHDKYAAGESLLNKYESIFKDEIQEALKDLSFGEVIKDYAEIYGERIPFHIYPKDEFSVYLRLFVNTYKTNKKGK